MKTALTSPLVLALFREGRETRVELNVSTIAVGGVLSQKDEQTSKWHPTAYYSQKMPPKFQNEVVYDLELQGLVKMLNHFREYLYGGPKFDVFTDHLSLTHIAKSKQQPSRRLARMVSKLAEYDFNIKYKKGKLNIVPDCLSRVETDENSGKLESKINKIKNKKLLENKSDSESEIEYSEHDSTDSELNFESDGSLTSSYESSDNESVEDFEKNKIFGNLENFGNSEKLKNEKTSPKNIDVSDSEGPSETSGKIEDFENLEKNEKIVNLNNSKLRIGQDNDEFCNKILVRLNKKDKKILEKYK